MLQLLQLIEDTLAALTVARRVMAFWGPVTSVPALLGPFVAIGSVLALALLSGVAVSSLSVFIVALVALYLVLTEVFGVAIDVVPA